MRCLAIIDDPHHAPGRLPGPHQHLTLQDADVVAAALVRCRAQPSITLSDYPVIEIARKAGHVPHGTFDRQLARLDGAQKL